jgi:hypothetical protein
VVNDYIVKDAATSSVLIQATGEAAVLRRTVSPVHTFDGTGLSFVVRIRATGNAGVGAAAVPMADQVQGLVDARGVVVPGIPPRGRPVRC